MSDARYFKKVHISAAAAMKMMSHAVSGVDKGMASGGKPVEVMGLLLGRPGIGTDRTSLIVTDSFALPIEGAETKVLADDTAVQNFMIELSDTLEETRKERFIGWYHSHPFDVEVHSHCYMSTTDVQTQLQWQRAEDPHGNPWLGIVIDPLRSLAKGRPELAAFRAFPPEYKGPKDMTPDGAIVSDNSKIDKWGAAWDRYHSMEIQYFMSSLSSRVSTTISQNFLWKTALSTTPVQDREYRDRFPERIHGATEKLESENRGEHLPGMSSSMFRGIAAGLTFSTSGSGGDSNRTETTLDKVSKAVCDISVEQCQGYISQSAKKVLFG
jgi:COP9 signalosome complex subunit 5